MLRVIPTPLGWFAIISLAPFTQVQGSEHVVHADAPLLTGLLGGGLIFIGLAIRARVRKNSNNDKK